MKSAGANRVEGRILVYTLVCAVLLLVSFLVPRSTSRRGRELHTLLGTIATPLALFTSAIEVVRHYTRKSRTFLLLGSGFQGAALLDGCHAVVTSSFLARHTRSLSSLHLLERCYLARLLVPPDVCEFSCFPFSTGEQIRIVHAMSGAS